MSHKRATIYEVAARAGVSHQTVSRYLRNNGGLKPATATKVQAAIEELSYRPNLVARSMRTRRSGRVAILLPAATSLPLRLLSAAAARAHAAGYAIDLLGLETSGRDRIARAQELVDSGQFEGILALSALGDLSSFDRATPIVIVSDYDDELRGLGAIADGAACGEVIQALAQLGHTQFLHLAGPQDYASARNRRKTFVETTAQLGLSGTVLDCDWHGQSGYDQMMGLPADTGVTAVVAANDLVATGAIRAVLSRGWKVPRDVSVVGWDDREVCRFTTPSLSTVAIDRERQGREAMDRLVALIDGTEPPTPDTTNLQRFIRRESIGPAPRRRKPLRAVAGP